MSTGRGAFTPDGCAVEVYTLAPPKDIPRIVHDAVPGGAEILELGCGAGRITHPLIELGHPVTAVDESPEMLERVHGAQKVRARIEDLRLDRTFPVVLLGSHLVHVGEPVLHTCRAHLAPGGQVLAEWHTPRWFDAAHDTEWAGEPLATRVRGVVRHGSALSATAEYRIGGPGGEVWTHPFTVERLGEDDLFALLGRAGLAWDRWLTEDRRWFAATAA